MNAEQAEAVAQAQAQWKKEQPQRLAQSLALSGALVEAFEPVRELAQRYEVACGDRIVPALVEVLGIEMERARALALAEAQAAFAETEADREAGVGRMVELLSDAAALRLRVGAALVADNSQALSPHVPSCKDKTKHVVPEAETRHWISALVDDRHILGSQADAFEKVKAWAQDSFPPSPTDAEILTNSATPDLLRYLLGALRAYDGEPQNLPTAFGLRRKGKRGNPGAVKNHGVEIEEAARLARDDAIRAGKTPEEAMRLAVEASLQEFLAVRDADKPPDQKLAPPDKKREKELRRQIRELLEKAWG